MEKQARFLGWAVMGLILVVVLGVLVWLVILPGVSLASAERALREHDPDRARMVLQRYLERWPNDASALLFAAQAARRAGYYAEAERLLGRAEEAHAASEATELEWELLGVQQGDFGGQENRLRMEVGRDAARALLILEALAQGYDAAYRWPEALATVEELLKREPDHVLGLRVRAAVLVRLRKLDEAEKALRRAVERGPGRPRLQAALAEVLSARGYNREAIYYYGLARADWPNDPGVLLGLARAWADAAELAQAEETLEELLQAHQGHLEGLLERGRLALRQGKTEQAATMLARVVERAPWHREAAAMQVVVLKELGRQEEVEAAEKHLQRLREEDAVGGRLKLRARDNPGEIEVRWRLWEWSWKNGLREEGFAWLTEVLKRDPRHVQGHQGMAEYFREAGQPRRADMHYRPATGRERAASGEKGP